MVKGKKQNVWRHFTDKNGSVECNYCSQSYKHKNVNKCERHLLVCLHCPDVVKSQLKSNEETKTPTQSQSRARTNYDSDNSSSSATIMSASSGSRSATPQSISRPTTPNVSNSVVSTSNPMAMFLDRMSDDENVRTNFLLNFISLAYV